MENGALGLIKGTSVSTSATAGQHEYPLTTTPVDLPRRCHDGPTCNIYARNLWPSAPSIVARDFRANIEKCYALNSGIIPLPISVANCLVPTCDFGMFGKPDNFLALSRSRPNRTRFQFEVAVRYYPSHPVNTYRPFRSEAFERSG
jgi:hypothetical protein